MKFHIRPDAGTVEIDGRAVTIDLSGINPDIAEVQWFGGAGLITYRSGGDDDGPRAERFISAQTFAGFIAAAQAAITEADTVAPPTLGEIKAAAAAEIDALAGIARSQFITVAPGQEMTYLEKVTQAQALLAVPEGDEIDEDDFPLMFGEVGITADNAAGVAAIILQRYLAWQAIGATIERTRLLAKKQVGAAVDAESVAAVIAALSWPQAP